MRSSGRSATSGSRLFWIMRKAASCGQPRQCSEPPRGARTTRAVTVTVSIVHRRRLAPVAPIRPDARKESRVLSQRGDQALLQRRLLGELKPIFHEDPPQPDVVGESCELGGGVWVRHIEKVDTRQCRSPIERKEHWILAG